MPILELTHLRTPSTPSNTPAPSKPSITTALQQVRTHLAAKVHATHSRFYTPIPSSTQLSPSTLSKDDDKTLDIYILASWPSLKAHTDFLQNPVLRDEVLGAQEGILGFIQGEHYELTHTPTIHPSSYNPSTSSSKSPIIENLMGRLPLTSPILVLTRIEIPPRGEEKSPGHMALDSHRMNLQKRGGGYASLILLDDADATSKKRCYIILSGWESISSYTSWREESGVDSEGCVEVLVLQDLERGE
ncbi:hypothetical protein HYFRA_00010745 [Hymenoscyphus fraxineus]|uniref:ABM domain-containing protein n=1 Tax=Hymenoscyphus fraxineus TaxID=746836 RepID=A0A9N9PX62_9HELO|nr:hypothetical protein HYFRA_00010745 [Hymenoscyphus fraxineus]